jgi:hypothetical protein
MTDIDAMTQAYIEAIYFTETGDSDQPSAEADLTALCKLKAHMACRNFLEAIRGQYSEAPVDGLDSLDMTQLGHDLWLTRNHHGAGFWDRPEIYGQDNATLFTRIATAIGEHDAEFEEELECA